MMVNRYYRVDRSDICFIKYLLESYEGVATLSTLNAVEGTIVVRIAPGCAETVTAVMASLAGELYFEPLDAAAATGTA